MQKRHQYQSKLIWTGNKGSGTSSYKAYERSYTINFAGKPLMEGSADPAFRGDPSKYNPEEMLIASLSSCHMLWYLHLCSVAGIRVKEYGDEAKGVMVELENGSGRFEEVVLYISVVIQQQQNMQEAAQLHEQANKMCFIANSCNFPVKHQIEINAIDI
jgi:organic hydroperoxide reductase OsmC/OhrA